MLEDHWHGQVKYGLNCKDVPPATHLHVGHVEEIPESLPSERLVQQQVQDGAPVGAISAERLHPLDLITVQCRVKLRVWLQKAAIPPQRKGATKASHVFEALADVHQGAIRHGWIRHGTDDRLLSSATDCGRSQGGGLHQDLVADPVEVHYAFEGSARYFRPAPTKLVHGSKTHLGDKLPICPKTLDALHPRLQDPLRSDLVGKECEGPFGWIKGRLLGQQDGTEVCDVL
mmetsp:Transcript_64480/g.178775  ORF Transcript_64480/g.178775 Transcript_64480/m.178775 type:complete len:230 (+) Transcript_64480:2235-2924(+)